MTGWRKWSCVGVTLLCYTLTGCTGDSGEYKTADQIKQDKPVTDSHDHDHDHGHDHDHDHGHEHKAPHGGSLTMLGEHVAQFELLVDAATGKLTLYILDGEAEKPLMVEDKELELVATLPGAEAGQSDVVTLKLQQIEPGKLESGFTVESEALKGKTQFAAVLSSIKTSGGTHEKVKLKYAAPKAADAHADEKHGDEKHADEKPAEEKPAEEKPAEDKAADEKPAE